MLQLCPVGCRRCASDCCAPGPAFVLILTQRSMYGVAYLGQEEEVCEAGSVHQDEDGG